MTLDDPERHNMVFMDFLAISGLQDTFQEQIVPKSIEIDTDELHMKFSALNADFNGPKTCARGNQRAYHCESHYFTGVGQSFTKTVADHHGHAAYHNKH